MTHWTSIIGYILIIAGARETISVINQVNSGELKGFPYGAIIGTLLIVALSYFLIRYGIRKRREKGSGGLL